MKSGGDTWGFSGSIYPRDMETSFLKYSLKLYQNSALNQASEHSIITERNLWSPLSKLQQETKTFLCCQIKQWHWKVENKSHTRRQET